MSLPATPLSLKVITMAYIGRDGLTHQETIIDWDKSLNTKISTIERMSKKDKQALIQGLKDNQLKKFNEVLAFNPSFAMLSPIYEIFVKRNNELKRLEWDVEMLNGKLVTDNPITSLFFWDMCIFLEKCDDAYKNNLLDLKTPQIK